MDPPTIPLTLYVHLPWCVRKCPYCDFNSHESGVAVPDEAYVDALLADLTRDLPWAAGRAIDAIFIGGGTPSLFSGASIARLLDGIRQRLPFASEIEITLEANPGTVEQARFTGYRAIGVNRLSIGIQSLDDTQLKTLGRIHGAAEARRAVAAAHAAGFDNFNLDMMYALPQQTLVQARIDLEQLLALEPAHISYYQLTLEAGTPFYHQPPPLPDDELAWEMQLQGQTLLAAQGYEQYEVSAYARSGRQSRHNLNYWQFGDYLGIGAGAHGKLNKAPGQVWRREKLKFPQAYMQAAGSPRQYARNEAVPVEDLPFEYLLNALRLNVGFDLDHFRKHSGGTPATLDRAFAKGLLERSGGQVRCTPLGQQHLNALLRDLLPERELPRLAPVAVNQ